MTLFPRISLGGLFAFAGLAAIAFARGWNLVDLSDFGFVICGFCGVLGILCDLSFGVI